MSRQKGFTIIEVMLFLAISGALFFVVMRSTAGTISNVRNDDARDSVLSYLQRQYNNVATNNVGRPLKPGERVTCSGTKGVDIVVSSATTSAGASDTCVVLGVEIVNTGNPITGFKAYPVLGYANPAPGINSTDALRKSNPVTWRYANQKIPGPDIDRAVSSLTIPWGTTISDRKLGQIAYGDPFHRWFFTSIAFLRNPSSGSVDVVFVDGHFGSNDTVFNALGRDVTSSSGGDEIEGSTRVRRNVSAIFCLNHVGGGNRRDAILFEGDGKMQSFGIDDLTATQGVQGDAYLKEFVNEGLTCG